MFSLYKCHLIKNSLSVILLSLILFNITLNQQGVNGDDESNLPYSQGYNGQKTINITNNFQHQKIMNWSNNMINNSKFKNFNPDILNILNTILQTNLVNRKEKITPRDLTINVKESDIMNQAFYNNIKTNDSNENWDYSVTDVELKQDIICCYRKTSNDTTKFEDWKKLFNIAEGFTIYSVKNNRSKYLICLKKINIDEITTMPSILETILASSRKEIEFNGTKNGRNNKKKNININKNINLHNSDKNCDEYDDAKINQADDLSCLENKSTTIVLENVTSKYTKNKVSNIPNYFQENFLAKNINKNKYFINNEYRHNKRYPINYRQIYDRNLKMRKAMKKTKLLILISGPINIYKIQQPNKLIFLLKICSKLEIKNANCLFYKNKRTNSFNKRIVVIPFILYLHRLHPLIGVKFLNLFQNQNSLSQIIKQYNQRISLCKNKYQVYLLPIGLLTLLKQFSFQLTKIFHQIYLLNRYPHSISPLVKTYTTRPNSLIPQSPKLLMTPYMKYFNTPVDMNINHHIQNKNKYNIKKPSININTNYEKFVHENIKNTYETNINNTSKNIEMRMMDRDTKDLNNTTESFIKTESTTQYLYLSNESTNISNSINENTSIKNDVIE